MLVGFKPRFRLPIENGSKIHTMRNTPKRMPKVGETMYMYTGLRTKNCSIITKEHTLKSIQKINVEFVYNGFDLPNKYNICTHTPIIKIDSNIISVFETDCFFVNDGFENESDFISFWNLPEKQNAIFEGYLFHWTELKY